LVLLALLVSAAGCGSHGDKPVPVRGKVYYHGAPLTTGFICFVPDPTRGGHGPMARGSIGRDGSYSLRTGTETGAVPGCYQVTILAHETLPPGDTLAVPRSLVPDKYSAPELSGLKPEVKAGQENIIDFPLE